MTDETSDESERQSVEPGTVVYDESGGELGVVTEMTEDGFEVSIELDDTSPVEQEHEPGQDFGEGYIMWRCSECGEMGKLEDGFPTECPDCGADAVEKWVED